MIQNKEISIFRNVKSPDQKKITINNYFKGILEGRWQDYVLDYRTGKKDKKSIPAATVSGNFDGRNDKDLVEHSGLIVIDIDKKDQQRPVKDIRDDLREIPELYAIHYSLSGEGLAAYFRIKKDKHRESYEAISIMLANDYQVIVDPTCKNISRLRYVSYDPELHMNQGAVTWKTFIKKAVRVNEFDYNNVCYVDSDIDHIMHQIRTRRIDIAPDYASWLRIGFALANELGERGRGYFELISSCYTGSQKTDPNKQYDRCLRSDAAKSGGVSIKSLFYYAKMSGCDIQTPQNKKITSIAKLRRKQEKNGSGELKDGKEDARKYLADMEKLSGPEVESIIDKVWKLPESELTKSESLLSDLENFLKSNYRLRYNEILLMVEVDGEFITDRIRNTVTFEAKRVVSEKIGKEIVGDLLESDFTPSYNPFLEFIEKNKGIKPKGNIAKLAKCINSKISKVDPTFVEYFLRKWLLGIIGSIHGTYSILCLVLAGQMHGSGKSKFFQNLLPEELQYYFCSDSLDSKESHALMAQKILILDDEFGGKSKNDEKVFKALISSQSFDIRRPYGRYIEKRARLAVLCGTTNEEEVLNDITGNRRIIPIQVNSIDHELYKTIDKTELFIEMYWAYREDIEGWFLSNPDIERLAKVCSGAQQSVPEMELPMLYFDPASDLDAYSNFRSSSEIRSIIEKMSGLRINQQKLVIALKNLGFMNDRQRINGSQMRGYWVFDKWDKVTGRVKQ